MECRNKPNCDSCDMEDILNDEFDPKQSNSLESLERARARAVIETQGACTRVMLEQMDEEYKNLTPRERRLRAMEEFKIQGEYDNSIEIDAYLAESDALSNVRDVGVTLIGELKTGSIADYVAVEYTGERAGSVRVVDLPDLQTATKLILDLEAQEWSWNERQRTPIGQADDGGKGVLGVYDRTKTEHLSTMVGEVQLLHEKTSSDY